MNIENTARLPGLETFLLLQVGLLKTEFGHRIQGIVAQELTFFKHMA